MIAGAGRRVPCRRRGGPPQTIPVNDLVTAALERYIEDRRALVRHADLRPLFLTKRYKRMTVRTVRELVRRCGEEAGGRSEHRVLF